MISRAAAKATAISAVWARATAREKKKAEYTPIHMYSAAVTTMPTPLAARATSTEMISVVVAMTTYGSHRGTRSPSHRRRSRQPSASAATKMNRPTGAASLAGKSAANRPLSAPASMISASARTAGGIPT